MKFDLAVTVREKSGKGAARQLRRSGKVPGVLYGQGECLLLTIEPEPLIKILKSQAGSTALISLTVNGAKSKPKRTALLRDFQVDPVEGQRPCMPTSSKFRWTSRFVSRCRSM